MKRDREFDTAIEFWGCRADLVPTELASWIRQGGVSCNWIQPIIKVPATYIQAWSLWYGTDWMYANEYCCVYLNFMRTYTILWRDKQTDIIADNGFWLDDYLVRWGISNDQEYISLDQSQISWSEVSHEHNVCHFGRTTFYSEIMLKFKRRITRIELKSKEVILW